MTRTTANDERSLTNLGFPLLVLSALLLPALLFAYFGLNIHTALSGSMAPQIQPGDELVSVVVPVRDVHVGDIVMLLSPETSVLVAHRVVGTSSTDSVHYAITTKGDANAENDAIQSLNGNMTVRKVRFVIPKLGYVLAVASSSSMRGLGGIALVILSLFFVFQYRKRRLVMVDATIGDEHEQRIINSTTNNIIKLPVSPNGS